MYVFFNDLNYHLPVSQVKDSTKKILSAKKCIKKFNSIDFFYCM